MLGLEDYGSDVESGDELLTTTSKAKTTSTQTSTTSTSSLLSKLPPPTSKSTFIFPPPKASSSTLTETSSSSSTAVKSYNPAPSKPKQTKKIAINLPSIPPPNDDEDNRPPAKKPRLASNTGAGKSSLLSILPAPKQPVHVIEKKEERVLGGGGGPGPVFRTSKSDGPSVNRKTADIEGPTDMSSTSFLPPSLKKGKANVSPEGQDPSNIPPFTSIPPLKTLESDTDIFSLGLSTPNPRSTPTPSTASAPTVTRASPSFSVSSAPVVSTFRPLSPTLDDPYPGYYQLPSGAYAPYDANYYASYAKKWKADYEKHIRELEKAQYEPEADGAQNVDTAAEMEKARKEVKEREDRKALTMGNLVQNENGEPSMPRMNVKGAKLGSVARSRHQLTTLLTEAYLNREALEEKIAQGRRNRKEAGMKYGF